MGKYICRLHMAYFCGSEHLIFENVSPYFYISDSLINLNLLYISFHLLRECIKISKI